MLTAFLFTTLNLNGNNFIFSSNSYKGFKVDPKQKLRNIFTAKEYWGLAVAVLFKKSSQPQKKEQSFQFYQLPSTVSLKSE